MRHPQQKVENVDVIQLEEKEVVKIDIENIENTFH